MTSTSDLREEIQNLMDFLLTKDIALVVNPVSTYERRISWHSHRPDAEFMPKVPDGHIGAYRHWAANGMYSAVLVDGSLLQVTYWVEGGRVIKHRLAWVPTPADVDRELLLGESLVDALDYTVAESHENVRLRSAVRLDYDEAAAAEFHPAAHLTINTSDCRIAAAGPVPLTRFIDFIFRHFYADLWHAYPYLRRLPQRELGVPTLSEAEAQSMHFYWRRT